MLRMNLLVEFSFLEVAHGLAQFRVRVHHERATRRDRLVQRRARQDQHSGIHAHRLQRD